MENLNIMNATYDSVHHAVHHMYTEYTAITVEPFITLARVGGGYSTLFVFVCVCVCVLPQNCCLNSIITKSKQVAALKLDNLRQTVALYKTG